MAEKHETTSSNGEEPEVWGTLGELLLACAVNRHGTNSWDSIADELRKRLNHNFSPHNCKLKYVDLKNRFHFSDDQLLRVAEDLRKIRVEELKREVQRHNHSIVSLQLKVKRLKEERERSSSMAEEPDPRIEPDGTTEKADEPDLVENRSFNESNESNHKCVAASLTQEEAIERKPKREPEEKGEITSYEPDSIRTRLKDNPNRAVRPGVRRRVSSGDELLEARANKRISLKSQPLIKFLETLRSHKHGSAFRGRLPSQETEKYQHLIRQHMDLDTVEYRLNKGIYTDCHPKFYRDLLLIFTNAVIFYRKSSAEHIAARELRKLVIDEIALRTHKPNGNETQPIKPDPNVQQLDPVVKKPRSSSTTSTMVLCRRRSSGSSHATSNNGVVTRSKDKNGNYKFVTKERTLSGQRGLRVMNDDANINVKKKMTRKEAIDNNKKENDVGSESEVDEPMEMTLKKISVDQKEKGTITRLKKQGMANFLKRIKQNSPSKQENKKEVSKDFEDIDEEEDEDEDEDEEVGRRAKTTTSNNNNNNKGKKMRGGNVKRNNGNGNENGGGTKERRSMGRNLMTKRMSPKNGKTSSPDSGKGGKRSLRRDGDENSRKRSRR